jgi:hypothetical protein
MSVDVEKEELNDRECLISFRVSRAMHTTIKRLGKVERRPISYQCEKLLQEALEHRGERLEDVA